MSEEEQMQPVVEEQVKREKLPSRPKTKPAKVKRKKLPSRPKPEDSEPVVLKKKKIKKPIEGKKIKYVQKRKLNPKSRKSHTSVVHKYKSGEEIAKRSSQLKMDGIVRMVLLKKTSDNPIMLEKFSSWERGSEDTKKSSPWGYKYSNTASTIHKYRLNLIKAIEGLYKGNKDKLSNGNKEIYVTMGKNGPYFGYVFKIVYNVNGRKVISAEREAKLRSFFDKALKSLGKTRKNAIENGKQLDKRRERLYKQLAGEEYKNKEGKMTKGIGIEVMIERALIGKPVIEIVSFDLVGRLAKIKGMKKYYGIIKPKKEITKSMVKRMIGLKMGMKAYKELLISDKTKK